MRIRIVVLVLLAGFFFVDDGWACTCVRGQGPGQAFRDADVVVLGTVVEVNTRPFGSLANARAESFLMSKSVKIAVAQAWKGLQGENEVVIHTGSGGGDCGFGFVKGEQYLIYAYRAHNPPHHLTTGICTRTATHARAQDDLLYLRRLPLLKSSYVYGYVRRDRGNWPDATVALVSGLESRAAQTDENGRFEFDGLPSGEYTVKLIVPEEFDPDPYEQNIKLKDRDCTEILFWPRPGVRIEGVVRDLVGRPAVRLVVKGEKRKESSICLVGSQLRA